MPNISIPHAITEINAEKLFAVKITTSASDQTIDLAATQMPGAPTGEFVCNPAGVNQPMLMLQCDADFRYAFGSAAVTLPAGSNPGTMVKLGDQEFVRPAAGPGRTVLHVLQNSASGVLCIYVLRTSIRA